MAAQIEGTSYDGEEAKSNHDSEFAKWLKAQNASILIEKLLAGGVDDMEMLKSIKTEDIDKVSLELNLTLIQKAKLKLVFQKVPDDQPAEQKINIADTEEINAISKMNKKLSSIQNAINQIDNEKQKINEDMTNQRKLIDKTFNDLQQILQERKTLMMNKLNDIGQQRTVILNNKSNQLSEQHKFVEQQINISRDKLNNTIDFDAIQTRKKEILQIAEIIEDIPANVRHSFGNSNIVVRFDNDLIPLISNILENANKNVTYGDFKVKMNQPKTPLINDSDEKKDAIEKDFSFIINKQNKDLLTISNNGKTVRWKGKTWCFGRTILFGQMLEGNDKLTIYIELKLAGDVSNYTFGFINKEYTKWDNHNGGTIAHHSIWVDGGGYIHHHGQFKKDNKNLSSLKSFLYSNKNTSTVGVSVNMTERIGFIWNESNRRRKLIIKLPECVGIAVGFEGSEAKSVTVISAVPEAVNV